jgi:hypothetical protein
MKIMDDISNTFDTLIDGMGKVLINKDYIFVEDKEGNIICTLYDTRRERGILNKYLEENNISKDEINIIVANTLESEDMEELFRKYQIFE